jgi:hypothetical protein
VSKRTCLFCGDTPVSSEHAMPLWTGKVIPGSGPWIHRHAERHGDNPIRGWSKNVPDLKCNAACRSCNEGWMARLEDRGKPILTPLIQGRSTRLELHDIATVCFWALKTSLMLDRCSDADRQSVPRDVFAELYAAQTVLPSAYLWIGSCDVARGSWFQARTLDLDSGDATTPGFGATLWVGRVVFEVIAVELVGPVTLGLKEDALAAMAPIWPRNFKLDWPVTPAMTQAQVVELGDRIAESGLRIYPR